MRSYAAPQAGINQERLVVAFGGRRVHMTDWDDDGGHFDVTLTSEWTAKDVLSSISQATRRGTRSVAGIKRAVRQAVELTE